MVGGGEKREMGDEEEESCEWTLREDVGNDEEGEEEEEMSDERKAARVLVARVSE